MGRKPLWLGLLLAGLSMSGCEWCGRGCSLSGRQPTGPSQVAGASANGQGWNNSARPTNTTPPALTNRSTAPSSEYNQGLAPRKPNDPHAVQNYGVGNSAAPPITQTGGVRYRTPAENNPPPPEDANPEAGSGLSSPSRPPVYRPE